VLSELPVEEVYVTRSVTGRYGRRRASLSQRGSRTPEAPEHGDATPDRQARLEDF
jgi:hypothetical protein